LFKKIGEIMNNDWRTDNWAGHRDVGRDPNNYRFPRTSREAGIGEYYSSRDDDEITVCGVCIVLAVIAILFGISLWVK
jgi:hypothetical protein